MRRRFLRWTLATAAAAGLLAQSGRDDYRAAYRDWRQADLTLENDAAAGGESVAQRADRVAAGAAKYGAARDAFLNALADELEQKSLWLENAAAAPPAPAESTRRAEDRINAESTVVERAIQTFTNDPDPAIQQLRLAMEKERAALGLLSGAISERQKAVGLAQSATAAAETIRTQSMDAYRGLISGLKQTAAQTQQETAAWAGYYQKLSVDVRAEAAPAPAPAPPVSLPPVAIPETSVRLTPPPSITPLPLPRYTGAWVFPAPGGLYHFLQPESVDLVVREDSGHASGTLMVRFKLPPGSGVDPELRFDFGGDFKNTRIQTFTLQTSDGASGTIDLIPGAAFNLLEVNFQTEMKAGKVRQGNFVLIKK